MNRRLKAALLASAFLWPGAGARADIINVPGYGYLIQNTFTSGDATLNVNGDTVDADVAARVEITNPANTTGQVSVTVTNSTLTGHTGAGVEAGTVGGGQVSVTNSSAIGGATASVSFFGNGQNTLNLNTGSTLTGAATGSTAVGANNALVLQGAGTANNAFQNFNTVDVNASGAWTMGGTSSFSSGAIVNTGTLNVTGSLTSAALSVAGTGALVQTGAGTVHITGDVSNTGGVSVNANIMTVGDDATNWGSVSIGASGTKIDVTGTYTQNAGSTILHGGTLSALGGIVNNDGTIGGTGTLIGTVTVIGGTVDVGASPDALHVVGDFHQTGGTIQFEVDPDGSGGFLWSSLIFDSGAAIDIDGATIEFDFVNGADPVAFLNSGHFKIDSFFDVFASIDPSVFDTTTFTAKSENYTIGNFVFDPATGAQSLTANPVPEPPAWAMLIFGLFAAGGAARFRRRQTQA